MSGLLAVHGAPVHKGLDLRDPYGPDTGIVFLTGVQALVRVLLDQRRADAANRLRTATLVSGYQGSPLAGFDRELNRIGALARDNDILLRQAVNEELGATAVWGSQLAGGLPEPRFDGVVGVWYGKAPGVDRAADAIRHGNYVGTDPCGGVLALCGDDPSSKSSTLPSASESMLAALGIPVLAPGSVQEALDLGRHAIACSRASGLWVALKIVTNVADAAATVEVGLDRVQPQMPVIEWEGAPYVHRPSPHLLPPESLDMERTLVTVRLELARRYGRLNGLNRIVRDSADARLGIVAAGAVAEDTKSALNALGLARDGLVRLIQLGMIYPLDEEFLRDSVKGLDEVLVLEEKGPFLERMVKAALYGSGSMPLVTGNRDEHGSSLIEGYGVLDADRIARAVGRRILARGDVPRVRAHLDELETVAGRLDIDTGARRTPYFCSGCPHNSSTVADDAAIVGAGIGCHTMVMLAPGHHGRVTGLTQMGGEGAQWIGAAPFVGPRHFIQNLGDGTFHHSGSLAVRAAVAANLNVTYKLLFNGAVAMTGGQRIEGGMGIPETVRSLAAEGVRRIVVTTENQSFYDGVDLPAVAEVRHRSEISAVQRELTRVDGVTVLLHDQSCALDLRRGRKRGLIPDPPQEVVINERICEGCGDCGDKSGCLSVEPVDTEFGRKTRIDQTSCNKDFSCLVGDCPSFLTIISPAREEVDRVPRVPNFDLPEPTTRTQAEDVRVRLVGIGGTGVVTVSQVLGMAAMLDGRHTCGLDQTGLSQKAGPVVSDVHLSVTAIESGASVPSAAADVLLGLDVLTAATGSSLRVADRDRTVAVVSESVAPTATMVTDVEAPMFHVDIARTAIDAVTRERDNVYLDAQRICEVMLGDTTTANVVVLGAAWQLGALPVSLGALQEALRINGAAVDKNLAALAWGRAWVVAPDAVRAALDEDLSPPPSLSATEQTLVDLAAPEHGELRRLVTIRVPDLVGWGGMRTARSFAQHVARFRATEATRLPGSTAFAEAAAQGLHKLLAYKDEYEVARLHLEGLAELPRGANVTFHLQPPLIRALGMKRKVKLGPWFVPVFKALRRARVLRGTPLDPFGYAAVRRVERALPSEYLALLEAAAAALSPKTLPIALEAAALPDVVRGYEGIKLRNVGRFRERAAELYDELEIAPAPQRERTPQ